jgi:hypothetical protein
MRFDAAAMTPTIAIIIKLATNPPSLKAWGSPSIPDPMKDLRRFANV